MELIKITPKTKLETLPFNRSLISRTDLTTSMTKYGFTTPVLLVYSSAFGNRKLYVADGQHRIHCANNLNIDSYGIVHHKELNTIQELVNFVASINSSQKNWNIDNYVKAYASLNNEYYIKLLKIEEGLPWSITTIASLLFGIRSRGIISNIIKNGDFIVHKEEDTKNTIRIAFELHKYEPLTNRMLLALSYVSSMKDFNEQIFKSNYALKAKQLKELQLDDYTNVFLELRK